MSTLRRPYNETNVEAFGEIDPTDVPAVSVRELATALKVLADDVFAIAETSEWAHDDLERVDRFFWQRCSRNRQRKTAALVRLRSLVAVSRTRMVRTLLDRHGTAAALCLVETAATMRLNAKVGFSPIKMSCAVVAVLRQSSPPVEDDLKAGERDGGDVAEIDAARFLAAESRPLPPLHPL